MGAGAAEGTEGIAVGALGAPGAGAVIGGAEGRAGGVVGIAIGGGGGGGGTIAGAITSGEAAPFTSAACFLAGASVPDSEDMSFFLHETSPAPSRARRLQKISPFLNINTLPFYSLENDND